MNYFLLVFTILSVVLLFEVIVEFLNLLKAKEDPPSGFANFYPLEKYSKSQKYMKENTWFEIISNVISLIGLFIFTFIGGFNFIDILVRQSENQIIRGVLYLLLIILISMLFDLPFSYYKTFNIEERYGFNKSTIKIFIQDFLKQILLTLIIGSIIFGIILFIFLQLGDLAWILAWGAFCIFEIVILFLAPTFIMPLFNKFTPLPKGELKNKIMNFARSQKFSLEGIYTMDGSKRSTKSNAFFTGFGRFKRIVLFDTLIKKHTTDELVSVLAHEIGHYKKKHVVKLMSLSILLSGVGFYLVNDVVSNKYLFEAFFIESPSIYAGFVILGVVGAPVVKLIQVATNYLSRKFEFEADRFAVETQKKPKVFSNALKKLSVDNLSNLTPHPLKVFIDYSHPPVSERIEAIENIK